MKKIISILVRNHPGVLSHVAGLFTRRGYNIESIAAGETENPDVTRITIVVAGDETILEQVTKQLRKLIDVIKVQDLSYSKSITRELVLLTIFSPAERRAEVINVVNTFDATMVDIADKTVTLEFVGNARKVSTIMKALEGFKVKEIARTGLVALPLESQAERNPNMI
ncbi:MAG: acetolactate synthase small subunit [Deltaproteobacteria bacterium]|nr:acetolactate synthase small subunit [Deltaproteobacteria bacterium]MBW2051632.1 acetolactate synthase small subunit [Deltaproteobacteria bacterium]MBW2141587.1 acetolactate synthase small subunit [Deltaproteobacteria bacterium]MBW2323039.1 acetolactate synthase small subunit [Deltaproteobacteria bacterium]